MSKPQTTAPIIVTTLNNTQSKVSKFLLDPWSTVKVVLPAAAVQVVIHNTVLKKASLRELTLGLTLLNAFWFATTLNLSYIETPLLANVPSLDDWTKLDVGRHRFNWINKIEVSLWEGDAYEYKQRLIYSYHRLLLVLLVSTFSSTGTNVLLDTMVSLITS